MIGRLHSIVLDCPDAVALADFYAELTGLSVLDSDSEPGWVTLSDHGGYPRLCFQQIDDYRPPRWPDPAHPQQSHLDLDVDDINDAEPRVLALGASLLRGGGGTKSGFRVYADPAGHPFCLVWGQD
jgi:catechol 2,3-dioxygenase-like lactoylglutathione lyase family enzyme